MKKVLLVVLLLMLIGAVSYLKTAREHSLREEQFTEGFKEGVQTQDRNAREADSLKTVMVEQQRTFTDSLVTMEKTHRAQVDSLAGIIDDKDETLNSLTSNKTTAQKVDPASNGVISKHEEILRYYKKRFAELPNDLSEYEKRIAANEIREETSQKFAISLGELKEIRKKYKLSY